MSHNKIVAYQAYVPRGELKRQDIAEALGSRPGDGSRSVASFDEDAITMAVAAAAPLRELLDNGSPLYFATSTPPFLDKSNATIVATALGTDAWRLTTDFAGLRSGFAALATACATGGLVTMGDLRSGRPGSAEELDGGAGAAAFVMGSGDDAVAEIIGVSSAATELMDIWRLPGASHSQVWEERFSQHVLSEQINQVVAQVGKDSDFTGVPDYTLVSAPSGRFAGASAKSIGSSSETVDVLARHRARIGYCGAADLGLQLAQALDVAKAGETILLVSAVGSVDALMIRVLRDGIGSAEWDAQLAARRTVSYLSHLTWSGVIEREPTRRPERNAVSAPPAHRNAEWKYAFIAGRCINCGKVYLPAHRICGDCGSAEPQAPHPMADRLGTVAASSTDGVSDSPAPPALAAMIDFDGGGRLTMEVADASATEVELGTRVEPVFRRTYQWRGVPNYFWKVRPVKGTES